MFMIIIIIIIHLETLNSEFYIHDNYNNLCVLCVLWEDSYEFHSTNIHTY